MLPKWTCSLILWFSSTSFPDFSSNPAPSLQTELSLQKEQLQLKIIEIEDEAEKWQKEKDRIKVSRPQASLLLYSYPIILPEGRQTSCLRSQAHIYILHLLLLDCTSSFSISTNSPPSLG